MSKKIRAWHFVDSHLRLRYGDGRRVGAGRTYLASEPIKLCVWGLHASVNPYHALTYAPGPFVCRVECSGKIIHGHDKLVCTSRKVLWMADASNVIGHFTRLCALDVIHLWSPHPETIKFLRTGKEEFRQAARADASCSAKNAASATRYASSWGGGSINNAKCVADLASRAKATEEAQKNLGTVEAYDVSFITSYKRYGRRLTRLLRELGRKSRG